MPIIQQKRCLKSIAEWKQSATNGFFSELWKVNTQLGALSSIFLSNPDICLKTASKKRINPSRNWSGLIQPSDAVRRWALNFSICRVCASTDPTLWCRKALSTWKVEKFARARVPDPTLWCRKALSTRIVIYLRSLPHVGLIQPSDAVRRWARSMRRCNYARHRSWSNPLMP